MRVKQKRFPSGRSKDGDDVANAGAGNTANLEQLVAGQLVTNDRLEAHLLKGHHQPLAYDIVRRAVRRMRPLVAEDEGEPAFRTHRVELA